MTNQEKIQAVRDFVIEAHKSCEYHGGPFVQHLDQVAAILRDFGHADVEHQSIAYLHDLLEDTAVGERELHEFLIGITGAWSTDVILGATVFCTDVIVKGPRRLKKRATYRRMHEQVWKVDCLAQPTTYGVRVKVADRIANVTQCLLNRPDLVPMYLRERDAFYLALYREGICDAMWARLEDLHDQAERRFS